MRIGYARVSKADGSQSLDLQRNALRASTTQPNRKELAAIQKEEWDAVRKKTKITENRISAAERKRRTRRLILMGSYMEHITANDEAEKDRLMKGLDSLLERDCDRALFNLPSRPDSSPTPTSDDS